MPTLTGNVGPAGPPTALTSLTVAGVPIISGDGPLPLTSGSYFFVQSTTGSNGNTGSYTSPFATLVYAITQCTAAKNDVIVLMPGHAETFSSNTAITMSKSGVQVVGLGNGSLRPTLTIDTANTATINVTAANCSFTNCIIIGNFLSIAAAFTLTTAANFGLYNCLIADAGATTNFLNVVKSTGAANTIDGITLIGNYWDGLGTTSVSTFLLSANDIDRATLLGNIVKQVTTVDLASLMIISAGVLTDLNCGYNKTIRLNTTATAALISVGGTTSSGLVYNNYMQTKDTSTNVVAATTTGLSFFENFLTGVTGASGFIKPDRDT